MAHDQIADGSFESPRVGLYGDQWDPTNAGPWTFTGVPGLLNNYNYFNSPPAPDGASGFR